MMTLEILEARTTLFSWWYDVNGEYCEDSYMSTGSPYSEDWS